MSVDIRQRAVRSVYARGEELVRRGRTVSVAFDLRVDRVDRRVQQWAKTHVIECASSAEARAVVREYAWVRAGRPWLPPPVALEQVLELYRAARRHAERRAHGRRRRAA